MQVWLIAGIIIQSRNGEKERVPTHFRIPMKKAEDAVSAVLQLGFDDAYVVSWS
jgi:hypothetical protein